MLHRHPLTEPCSAENPQSNLRAANSSDLTGGPRIIEIIGIINVLENLPRQRVASLAVAFGLWKSPKNRAGYPTMVPGSSLNKTDLIATISRRSSVSPEVLWEAMTPRERIGMIARVLA